MELTKYYAVMALGEDRGKEGGGLGVGASNEPGARQDIKQHVCQLIDTVSQRLAFL